MNLHNKYELELIDAETLEVKQRVTTHNIVLNKWKDSIAQFGTGYQQYIIMGSGSGVPAATDTQLFNALIGYTGLTQLSFTKGIPLTTWVGTRTFIPSECIGTITEMGLYYQGGGWSPYTCLMSHALLKDSEGNPISIVKTATDILKVTVTTYFTFSVNHPDEGINTFMCQGMNNRVFRSHTDTTPWPATNWVKYDNNYDMQHTTGPDMYLHAHLADSYSYQGGIYVGQPTVCTSSVDAAHKGLMALTGFPTMAYTYGNGWNNGLGLEMKSIHIDSIGTFNITPAIFPQQPFGKYVLGIGDDTNVNFDLKVPSAVPGTQQVFVDNVLKTEGVDYVFTPKNTKDGYQNWASADKRKATYKKKSELYAGSFPTAGAFYPRLWDIDMCITEAQPIVYDFGEPIMVNSIYASTMLAAATPAQWVPGIWANKVDLEYSDDGIAWNKFATITSAMCTNAITTFAPITARYWRYKANQAIPLTTYSTPNFNALYIMNVASASLTASFEPTVLFGGYVPSVVFTTPPALNAVVEISHDIQYPVKNPLHEMNLSFTVEVQVS